jgi:hypothetical protein
MRAKADALVREDTVRSLVRTDSPIEQRAVNIEVRVQSRIPPGAPQG